MKKLLALLLALVMVLSIAACGTSKPDPTQAPAKDDPKPTQAAVQTDPPAEDPDDGEPYNVHILFRWTPPSEEGLQQVVDHINNNILPDLLPNTTISVQFVQNSEYVQTLKLYSANGTKVDLCSTFATYAFTDFVEQGAFLPLDDYLPYLSGTVGQMPEGWLDAVTIGGSPYAIPNYMGGARAMCSCVDKEMIEKYNIDTTKIVDVESYEELFCKVLKDNGEYAKGTIASGGTVNVWSDAQAEVFTILGMEQISEFLVVDSAEPTKIKWLTQSDGFLEGMNTLREWEEIGYTQNDLTGENWAACWEQNLVASRNAALETDGSWDQKMKDTTNRDTYTFQMTEGVVTTNAIRASMTALHYNSENPYRAAKVLELINTNEELCNALLYGVEGVHFTRDAEGKVITNTECGYWVASCSHIFGNQLIRWAVSGTNPDTTWHEKNTTAKRGATFGFSFNGADVATEIASCKAIMDEYKQGFMNGKFEDVEGTIAELNKKLEGAGLQAIIDECQAQLDAWYASK